MNFNETQWCPIGETLAKISRAFNTHDAAEKSILDILANGSLLSKVTLSYSLNKQRNNYTDSIPLSGNNAIIPVEFWQECKHPAAYKNFDWPGGRFTFDGRRRNCGEAYWGTAIGVTVNLAAIEAIAAGIRVGAVPSDASQLANSVSSRGRKPANWWPAFAEELALYAHDSGFPRGEGTEGQSEIIDAIFQRMADREMPEPSRTSVQPVVNAILKRWRAGN